ncbi:MULTISPECIES: DUF4365 domain-containing protein [Rhizobium]|uniref:DUF4365 domain-containing protein n=1 Tax=Rhizobium tumorigenes TaxID=2041385 RepID=A0AAF1K8U1_9HYPH|nr:MULTISPECIES: DUF4365 domain-containing protein [Rhizobium]MBO9102292.1 DUF4365 domain-containing protein [Rhizobium sp. L58/93]MBO9172215.1 DUF4365 domain-containing protein [Rhizobium sp. L245/93]MBO9187783.1 DUF4365 domain-containing protein [Rhizobium sp. E27B/91]QXZ87512.1 DUF4365 domain-containing protein [Rhizobium sp. K1/93]QXZ93552.1 DUF4365 domain-containing protein [Rhizobium sp. K15/93]
MKPRGNLTTERAGVNFVRIAVESAGSLFKEINLQHDYGHDATIMLVIDGQIRPREIAVQIKSGVSYLSPMKCTIPASADHLFFYAEHDLDTIGIVFDPEQQRAWWIDLRKAAREFRRSNSQTGTSISFKKSLWNEFNKEDFESILMPTLLGEAPRAPVDRLCTWVTSDDQETHDLGVRAIRARHRCRSETWSCLIETFLARSADQLSIEVAISLAMLLGHDNIGYWGNEIPSEIRGPAIREVLKFGPREIAKILMMLPDRDFERPSLGYSLMPLFGKGADTPAIFEVISKSEVYSDEIRELAGDLLAWYRSDPHFWRFWRRD